MITIPVYSEQDLTPRAAEVIRKILDDTFGPNQVKFTPAVTPVDKRVLVFGRAPSWVDTEYVFTYSVAQIMTKPNAATVLAAGVRQFIEEPEPLPFLRPLGTISVGDAMASLDPNQPTAIDIETDGNLGVTETPEEIRIISIAFYQKDCPPIVIRGVSNQETGGVKPLDSEHVLLLKVFLPQFKKAIYHNGKFDIRVMNRYFDLKLVNWFDTMLAHHVLNHAAGDHKLKTLARRLLGAAEWEADLKKYTQKGGHYENIPANLLVRYNGFDVYWTYKLYELFAPLIEADDNNIMAFNLEMAAADFLLDVETYGIPFDDEYADFFKIAQEGRARRALNRIHRITGEGFNPNSPAQVKKFIWERWDVELGSTDEDSLGELLKIRPEADQFVGDLLILRKAKKVVSTYIDGWWKHERNGRVHPTFHVHGTTTGRLSSSSPNAQNVPRDKTIRKLVKTHG